MWSDPAATPSVRALCVVVRDLAQCGRGPAPESAVLSSSRGAHDCAAKMPAIAACRGCPPQDAPKPAAQPAWDGAEVHIKGGGTVRPMESAAAD